MRPATQYKAVQDAERQSLDALRENTAALEASTAAYGLAQERTKGNAGGLVEMQRQSGGYRAYMDPNSSEYNAALAFYDPSEGGSTGSYAFGLERVPYDNYPALLHAGERC